MKHLLLACALLFASQVNAQTVPEEIQYNRHFDKYYAWTQACVLTLYRCSDMEIPKVEYVDTRRGLYGYYNGGDTISISNSLFSYQRKATLIHEMIHYQHVQLGLIEVPGFAVDICWSENEAFTNVDRWWAWNGQPEKQRGADWWIPYTHCWPYYDPDFDLWDWFYQMAKDGLIDFIEN